MLPGLVGLSYKERLNRLGQLSLEQRRQRGDLLEAYKMRSRDRYSPAKGTLTFEDSTKQADVLKQVDVGKEDVLEILKDTRTDKFPGPDGIYPRLMREEIAALLAMIFASSLSTEVVPDDWRVANVIPLFKGGNRDNPGNHRP
eukprot:g31295.t1